MMNVYDYAEDFVMTKAFEDYVDNAFWSHSFLAHEALELMVQAAQEDGIQLAGISDFDYEEFFDEAYEGTEKGLS